MSSRPAVFNHEHFHIYSVSNMEQFRVSITFSSFYLIHQVKKDNELLSPEKESDGARKQRVKNYLTYSIGDS